MDWDDVRPKVKQGYTLGAKLDDMSLEELTELVSSLKQEIERVEGERKAKQARAAAADQLFKS